MTTESGAFASIPLELTGDDYPPAPRLANHPAAQDIDPDQPFTLSWDAYTGAGPEAIIVVGIEDILDDDAGVFESDFLPGSSTSVEIPAGTLRPERIYEVWILFANPVDKNDEAFSEGVGFAFYGSETYTRLKGVWDIVYTIEDGRLEAGDRRGPSASVYVCIIWRASVL